MSRLGWVLLVVVLAFFVSHSQVRSQETSTTTPELGTTQLAKPWSVRIELHPDLSFPSGNFYEGRKSGVGFGADVSVRLTNHFAIRAMASRAGLSGEDQTGTTYPYTPLIITEDNMTFSVWRYALAAEYYSWPGFESGGHFLYYVYSGLGGIYHSASGTRVAYDPIGDNYYWGKFDTSKTAYTINTGGGVTLALSRNFGLDLGVDMYVVMLGKDERDVEDKYSSTAFNFDLKVGIVIME